MRPEHKITSLFTAIVILYFVAVFINNAMTTATDQPSMATREDVSDEEDILYPDCTPSAEFPIVINIIVRNETGQLINNVLVEIFNWNNGAYVNFTIDGESGPIIISASTYNYGVCATDGDLITICAFTQDNKFAAKTFTADSSKGITTIILIPKPT